MSRDIKGTIVRVSLIDPVVRPGTILIGVLVPEAEIEIENFKLGGPATLNLPEAKNAS